MLVKDHTAASEELKAIAQSLPLRLPRNMPDGEKAEFNKMTKMDAAEFDQNYMKVVGIEHHRTDIAMFEERVEKAEQPKVKAFATKTLPIGTAYGVWVGIGAVGAAILGIVLFREPATLARLAFLAMMIVAIIGLKATSGH